LALSGPSKDQAIQFAVLLQAGLPAEHAILYFAETDDPGEVALILGKWLRSRALAEAQRTLLGKSWQDMTTEEMCDVALEQSYRSMAYLLFTTNYVTANAGEKGKIDTARAAIEAKKAGTAGKIDPLWQFIEDFKRDRAKKQAVQ
jgi:hypothetical protein